MMLLFLKRLFLFVIFTIGISALTGCIRLEVATRKGRLYLLQGNSYAAGNRAYSYLDTDCQSRRC